jgi:hypothetical protein
MCAESTGQCASVACVKHGGWLQLPACVILHLAIRICFRNCNSNALPSLRQAKPAPPRLDHLTWSVTHRVSSGPTAGASVGSAATVAASASPAAATSEACWKTATQQTLLQQDLTTLAAPAATAWRLAQHGGSQGARRIARDTARKGQNVSAIPLFLSLP